jgi:hypothetical protein
MLLVLCMNELARQTVQDSSKILLLLCRHACKAGAACWTVDWWGTRTDVCKVDTACSYKQWAVLGREIEQPTASCREAAS